MLKTNPAQIPAFADNAADQLRRNGITVLVGREVATDDRAFAYLGAAALGALIADISPRPSKAVGAFASSDDKLRSKIINQF